jgi:hypothetical protein
LSAKEPSKRVKDLFGEFLPDWDIRARAIPYSEPPEGNPDGEAV